MMNKVLKVLVLLPALLFLVIGVRWLVDPGGVAPQFGLTLETGMGLSSQIGDLSGYFLTLALCMVLAVVTGVRTWFYPPVMLLLFTAFGRTLAWWVYDADLAPAIALEIVVSVILIAASRQRPGTA